MKLVFVLAISFICVVCCNPPQNKINALEHQTLFSEIVKDSFIVSIKKNNTLKLTDSCRLVLVIDGRINLGKHVFNLFDTSVSLKNENFVLVFVSHIGDWHLKRRRDFLPSDISQNGSNTFGQASLYYSFLKEELMPRLQKQIPNIHEKIFIGHSFSGLFGLYVPLKDSIMFNRYYIISPSCWANNNEINKIENRLFSDKKQLHNKMKLYVGSREIINKVLFSTTEYYNQIKSHNYPDLYLSLDTLSGESHNSVVRPALNMIQSDLNN
ncbi:MAG: alpha/beta hydrolase-fold protein [Lacibacter sp.]